MGARQSRPRLGRGLGTRTRARWFCRPRHADRGGREIFASPTVDAIHAAISAVTGPSGCLLIVKNYAGDRLNFGLAAERARAEGLKVEMVIVADDIALENFAQPRGVAGTLFVHKIAGSYAEAGASLEQVTASRADVAKSVKTLGIATSACTIPGQKGHARLAAGRLNSGWGSTASRASRNRTPVRRRGRETDGGTTAAGGSRLGPLALLINNLGERRTRMAVFFKAILDTTLCDRVTSVVGPARLMTAPT